MAIGRGGGGARGPAGPQGPAGPLWSADVVADNTSVANWTKSGAAFTSDGTQLSLTAGNTWNRAVWNTPVTTPATVIVEAEFNLPADWSTDTVGIILTSSNAAGEGISFRLDGTDSVRFERDGLTNYGVRSISALALQTWHKFRFVRLGGEADGYINGAYVTTSQLGLTAAVWARHAGLVVYSSGTRTVKFRNLKTWSMGGLPA